MSDEKPQNVQFGSQPPADPEVQHGKTVGASETVASSPGDDAPTHDASPIEETTATAGSDDGADPDADASGADDAENGAER